MEKIFRHIETLLRRHDYVIVPGLGGFVYQYQSAVVFPDSIEPPMVTVSFNPLMNVSDGLLAIEYSRMEGVSFRESSAKIVEKIDALKTLLSKEKQLEFGNLGILSSDIEGKITFLPANNRHEIPANFGLNTLHHTAAVEVPQRKVISLTLPSARVFSKYAAVGIIAVGLFFAAPKIPTVTRNIANLIPTHLFQPQTEIEDHSAEAQPIKIAIPQAEIHVASQSAVETAELKHHVIVSCMATENDAEKLCEVLKKMNFQKAHILPPIKTYRVAIESFAAKEEAIQFMSHLRETNPQFSDAWVLSDK